MKTNLFQTFEEFVENLSLNSIAMPSKLNPAVQYTFSIYGFEVFVKGEKVTFIKLKSVSLMEQYNIYRNLELGII